MAIRDLTKPVSAILTGEIVRVRYEDGHEATFDAYTHGFGYGCEGLRGFVLRAPDGAVVMRYDGRLYRSGPRPDEHTVVFLDPGYTQQQVAEYWRSAVTHLNREYYEGARAPELEWAWRLVCTEGGFDLETLENGDATMADEAEEG